MFSRRIRGERMYTSKPEPESVSTNENSIFEKFLIIARKYSGVMEEPPSQTLSLFICSNHNTKRSIWTE